MAFEGDTGVPESGSEAVASGRASIARRVARDGRGQAVLIVGIIVIAGGFLLSNARDLWHGFLDLRIRGEALTQHRIAQDKRRREVDLRFQQGVAMLHIREYEHAITALHRVLELAPEMPEAHVNLGFALLGQGRHKPAADFFRSAIGLRADQRNAYYGLALALEGTGDRAGAEGAMRTYVHLAPEGDRHRAKAQDYLAQWEVDATKTGSNAIPSGHGDAAR